MNGDISNGTNPSTTQMNGDIFNGFPASVENGTTNHATKQMSGDILFCLPASGKNGTTYHAAKKMNDDILNGVPASVENDTTNHSPAQKPYAVTNMQDGTQLMDALYKKASEYACTEQKCLGSIMFPKNEIDKRKPGELRQKEEVKQHAQDFIEQYYASIKSENTDQYRARLIDIVQQIEEKGHYDMDEKELIFGVRLAWRNASRCIGRIQWKKIQVFDCRHVTTASQMFECILQHLKYATNKGKIRSTITVFPHRSANMKDFRVWNSQFIQYAGYRQKDGTVIGDPMQIEFTEVSQLRIQP